MQNNSQIPDAIIEFAKSAEIYIICEKIGSTFGLLIDQVGEIDSEIRGVLLGANKSSDFTEHIVSRLEISHRLAEQITEEVNNQVFKVLKTKIQSDNSLPSQTRTQANNTVIPTSKPSHISDLEKAGGFTIEDGSGPMTTESHKEPLADHLITSTPATPIAPIPALKPTPVAPTAPTPSRESTPMPPSNLPTAESVDMPKDIPPTPPIAKPSTIPNVIPSTASETPPAPISTVKPKQSDAYREPIN